MKDAAACTCGIEQTSGRADFIPSRGLEVAATPCLCGWFPCYGNAMLLADPARLLSSDDLNPVQ